MAQPGRPNLRTGFPDDSTGTEAGAERMVSCNATAAVVIGKGTNVGSAPAPSKSERAVKMV